MNTTKHACPRCGFDSSRDRWYHRHPVAAVLLALPAGFVGVLLAYPWFFVPLLIVGCTVWVDRRNRWRAGIAARADHEHRKLIADAIFRPQLSRVTPRTRPRGADHWSITQPIRNGA